MIEKNDWRLKNQEKYLNGRKIMKIPYFRWSKTWDHEHCAFCWDKFSEYEGDLHEGYVTADDKRTWIHLFYSIRAILLSAAEMPYVSAESIWILCRKSL